MIRVVYDGNLGNNLFQYSFARLLARRFGLQLEAPPIRGFPRTAEAVSGRVIAHGDPIVLRGQRPNIPDEIDRPVLLTGYFQRAEYYVPEADLIREWLVSDRVLELESPHTDDVVVGIRRRSDYIPQHGLPSSYYEEAIERCSPRRVFITTDAPNDPFVRRIAGRFGAKIRAPGALDNLAFIRRFSKIVISNSTFLWWGAFLSHANLVVFPRPAHGFWSESDPISRDIDLTVPWPSYQSQAAATYRSEFLVESAATFARRLNRELRSATRRALGIPPRFRAAEHTFMDPQ